MIASTVTAATWTSSQAIRRHEQENRMRVDEVPRVLAALDDRWRPLFAAAILHGPAEWRVPRPDQGQGAAARAAFPDLQHEALAERPGPPYPLPRPAPHHGQPAPHGPHELGRRAASFATPTRGSPPGLRAPGARLPPRPIGFSDEKIGPTASNDSDDLSGWARRDSNSLPPAPEAGALSR